MAALGEGRHFLFIDIALNIPLIFKSFCTFAIGWRNSTQRHIELKKRYANRSVRNLGNSRHTNDDCIVVLTHMAWAAIITSVCMGYPRASD